MQVWNERVNTCCFYYVWLYGVFLVVTGGQNSRRFQTKSRSHRQLSSPRLTRVGRLGPSSGQTSLTCSGRKGRAHLPSHRKPVCGRQRCKTRKCVPHWATVSDTSRHLKLNLTKPTPAAPPSRYRLSLPSIAIATMWRWKSRFPGKKKKKRNAARATSDPTRQTGRAHPLF